MVHARMWVSGGVSIPAGAGIPQPSHEYLVRPGSQTPGFPGDIRASVKDGRTEADLRVARLTNTRNHLLGGRLSSALIQAVMSHL